MDITAAKKISAYLKDVGIGITLQVMDENAFTNANYDNADDDLYIWSWTADIDPGYILSVFTTDQILNSSDSEYANPVYDKLYTAQAQAVIPAERKQIIDQMQQILSVFTTDQILNSSDSEYANPVYDKLYTAQAQAVIPAERKQIIDQMQQI